MSLMFKDEFFEAVNRIIALNRRRRGTTLPHDKGKTNTIINCKLQNENKKNSTKKSGTMFPLIRVKVSHLTLDFWWKKTRVTCTIAANKWATSRNLKIKNLFMLSVCISSYGCTREFGEHEKCVRVAWGAAESNSSFLSALQTSQEHP